MLRAPRRAVASRFADAGAARQEEAGSERRLRRRRRPGALQPPQPLRQPVLPLRPVQVHAAVPTVEPTTTHRSRKQLEDGASVARARVELRHDELSER